jgi:hypothetical protein
MLQSDTVGIGEVTGKRTSTTSDAPLIAATSMGNFPS